MNEFKNLWSKDTDVNVIASWLVGMSDGATYPITDRFFWRISIASGVSFEDIEEKWDKAIGPCMYFSVDDEKLFPTARVICDNLYALIEDVNAHPEKYVSRPKRTSDEILKDLVPALIEYNAARDSEWELAEDAGSQWNWTYEREAEHQSLLSKIYALRTRIRDLIVEATGDSSVSF